MVERREQGFVWEFVARAAFEALGSGVLRGLAQYDVLLVGLAVIGEGQDRV